MLNSLDQYSRLRMSAGDTGVNRYCESSVFCLRFCNRTCQLRNEERFPYFEERVCKARIWNNNDGALFKRLQAAAAVLMEDIASRCDDRYKFLLFFCNLEESEFPSR